MCVGLRCRNECQWHSEVTIAPQHAKQYQGGTLPPPLFTQQSLLQQSLLAMVAPCMGMGGLVYQESLQWSRHSNYPHPQPPLYHAADSCCLPP
jgi:hypothetical protein